MPALRKIAQLRTQVFTGALIALLGVGAVSIWGIGQFSRSAAWVEHSYQVLGQLEAVEAAVREVESAARAYRLTERATEQAQYIASLPLALDRANTLLPMVADNPGQLARAGRVRERVAARVSELQRLVDLQNEHGATEARMAMRAGRGTELMQALTLAITDMRAAERALLERRQAATDARARWLMGFVALGTALPMALLGLLLSGLSRENRRARRLEQEAREAMQALEQAAVRRDRLSEQRRSLGAYTGLLQSCQTVEEATRLTAAVIGEVLPSTGGRCYVLRASQNLAESAEAFGQPALASAPLLQPDQCWALRRGQPHRCEPGRASPRCAHVDATDADADVAWTVCVPLSAHGSHLGLLHLSGRTDVEWQQEDLEAVEQIAEQLSQTMANLQLRETLRVQSLRDPLTGLYNRRYLEENLSRELQRCERRGLPMAVMMLDVDHFKRFNDTHGHAAGDALLGKVGEVLASMTRGEDIACRYGGEEFTLVLPEAPYEVALRRAEEIRATVGATIVSHLRQSLGPVTVSIGLAMFPGDGVTPETLLGAADAALYRAKAQGRDRVVATA